MSRANPQVLADAYAARIGRFIEASDSFHRATEARDFDAAWSHYQKMVALCGQINGSRAPAPAYRPNDYVTREAAELGVTQ